MCLGKYLDVLAGTVLLLSAKVENDVLRVMMERLLDFLSKKEEIGCCIQRRITVFSS